MTEARISLKTHDCSWNLFEKYVMLYWNAFKALRDNMFYIFRRNIAVFRVILDMQKVRLFNHRHNEAYQKNFHIKLHLIFLIFILLLLPTQYFLNKILLFYSDENLDSTFDNQPPDPTTFLQKNQFSLKIFTSSGEFRNSWILITQSKE